MAGSGPAPSRAAGHDDTLVSVDPRESGATPLVTVVIPTYNQAEYVGDALDSVLSQTYSAWECIVVDDGSDDGTLDVVRAHGGSDSRVLYIRQDNAGRSAARNAAFSLAAGSLIQLLDADDVLGPTKLAEHVELLKTRPDVDLVYGRSMYFRGPVRSRIPDNRAWLAGPDHASPSGAGTAVLQALVHENFMVIEAPLFRRSLVDRCGGFDIDLGKMEDWELWIRFAIAGTTFLHDPTKSSEAWVFVRVHAMNTSRDIVGMLNAELAIRATLQRRLADEELAADNLRRTHECAARLGYREAMAGDMRGGFQALTRAARAEGRLDWLVVAAALPVLRLAPVRKLTARLRRRGSLSRRSFRQR